MYLGFGTSPFFRGKTQGDDIRHLTLYERLVPRKYSVRRIRLRVRDRFLVITTHIELLYAIIQLHLICSTSTELRADDAEQAGQTVNLVNES